MTTTCAALDTASYYLGDELGPLQVWWLEDGTLVDLSVAHTYVGKVIAAGTVIFETTAGFSGAAGAGTEDSGTPNLVKTWPTTGELNDLAAAGTYLFQVTATRTADGRQRTFQVHLEIRRAY